MLVYVLNKNRKPLMPCSPPKARTLLKTGKAKVLRREPFTIILLFGSSGYRQEVVGGMDTGSETFGCAAIDNNKILYQSEVTIRQEVSRKMKQRAGYRRTRRSRKTRYRPVRWHNRASMRKDGRLVPSLVSKVQSHLRERRFVESILPITRWKVELASFDIHKITNPAVQAANYQEGAQKNFYNKHATQVGIIKASLLKFWDFESAFGYETKFKREQNLHWPKSHFADAVGICCDETQILRPQPCVYSKHHVAKGDYQQTSGKRSEKRIPTGKLFGFRKFDRIKTTAGIGFVKGKRSSGRFSICDLHGNVIHPSINVRSAVRISARSSTLIHRTHSCHG
jgi:hypothetical protein